MSRPERIARWIDEQDIRDLIARYNRALDDRRVDDVVALFDPEGELHAMGASAKGHEALRAAFGGDAAGQDADLGRPVTAHHTTNVLAVVAGDEATAESDFLVVRRSAAGTEVMLAGRYHDRLVRTQGCWRFTERRARALAKGSS